MATGSFHKEEVERLEQEVESKWKIVLKQQEIEFSKKINDITEKLENEKKEIEKIAYQKGNQDAMNQLEEVFQKGKQEGIQNIENLLEKTKKDAEEDKITTIKQVYNLLNITYLK